MMKDCGESSQGQAWSVLHHFCSIPVARTYSQKGGRKRLVQEVEEVKCGEHTTISAVPWIQTHIDIVFHSTLMAGYDGVSVMPSQYCLFGSSQAEVYTCKLAGRMAIGGSTQGGLPQSELESP